MIFNVRISSVPDIIFVQRIVPAYGNGQIGVVVQHAIHNGVMKAHHVPEIRGAAVIIRAAVDGPVVGMQA